MTVPTQYFYDGQIRRFVSQFIRLVSDFYVEFGKNSNGVINLQRVPVMYGDPSRQVSQIIRNNSENAINAVPAMSVYIDALSYDQTRTQDPSYVQSMMVRQRSFDPVTGTYGDNQGQTFTVERVMPSPYKLGLKLDIWTSNTEQKLQLIEQLVTLFNPALEVQSTDNYIDWSSLSYALLTDVNWTSRSVPTGGEEPIDVATLKFELPIWISTSIKVKKLGVIQTVVNNLLELPDFNTLGPQQLITFLNYGVLMTTTVVGGSTITTLKLLKSSDVVSMSEVDIDTTTAHNVWATLLDQYGNFLSGTSEIRLTQPNDSQIVGTVAFNPTDPTVLIYTPFADTLPANTLDPINAIIDPRNVNVNNMLLTPATGTRYMILKDIGSFSNPEGAVAWQGIDGQDLVAHANDIIEYNGVHWTVSFDSANNDALQYTTNLTTGIQYKWLNNQWTKSYDGVYTGGQWSLAV